MNDTYMDLLKALMNVTNDKEIFSSDSKNTYESSVRMFNDFFEINNSDNQFKGEIDLTNNTIIEPCPIMYMGDLTKNFKTVFIALNPHKENPRKIADIKNWEQLANYHHPYHILHNDSNDYSENNDYWRVFGHMETRIKWSPFYKYVFCLHMALCTNNNNYNTWEDVKRPYADKKGNIKDPNVLSKDIIKKLNEYPIANLEMIPYKSKTWNISAKKVSKLFDGIKDKDDDNTKTLKTSYKNYLNIMKKFLQDHTDQDTYIILAGGMETKRYLLETQFGISETDMDEGCYQIFSCEKPTTTLIPSGKDKTLQPVCYGAAPVYFVKGKLDNKGTSERKFIILPAISPNNTRYKWLYDDVEKLVDEIKKHDQW